MNAETCTICQKKLADKRSLRRHMTTVHKQYVQTSRFECDECAFAHEKVIELETHMIQQHNSKHPRYCLYCNNFYVDNLKCMEHMNKNHGLPVWNADLENNPSSGILPSEQAFGGVLKTYDIPVGEHEIDLLRFMRSKRDEIENVVQLNTQKSAQKLQFSALVQLTKPTSDENIKSQPDRIKIFVNSKMQRVDFTGLSKSCFAGMVEQMLLSLNNFASHGSGWTVDSIDNVELRFVKTKPIVASSYLALPAELARCQYLLNIRNQQDEKYFLYCYTAQYHKIFGSKLIPDNASWRQKTNPIMYGAENTRAKQPVGTFMMPMAFNQMEKFEQLNQVRVNVFRHSNNKLKPFRISRNTNFKFDLDLLLLSDGAMHHYVLITNIKGLIHKYKQIQQRIDNHLFSNCFHISTSVDRHEKHEQICHQNTQAIIRMPKPEQQNFEFKNIQARWFAPIVGFFDLESIIEPVNSNIPQKSVTKPLEAHKPCSYALLFVALQETKPFFFKLKSGPDVMVDFVKSIEAIAKDIYDVKQQHKNFSGEPTTPKEDTALCWICETELNKNAQDPTVLDHCHFTGKFLGWAHAQCNLKRRTLNFTPLFAHNLANYDLHHVVLALQNINEKNTISVVPSTSEKIISLQIGVHIKTTQNKKGVWTSQYEYIRLLDSFKFMNASLDKLVQNLPADQFTLLEQHFEMWPDSSVNMLKQKGSFPYCCIDNFEKLEETQLPPRELWTNSLQQYEVTVTEEEYERAIEVFNLFACRNIGEYYNLYLKTDVFLLAAVVLCFQKVCYETYGLDCCQYYTASNLSGDAMLKICNPELHLLTQREHLDMVESLIRGGMSSVYSKRLCRANNKFLPDYKPKNISSFIIMFDANNLYGGIMEKFPLPLREFELFDKSEWTDENAQEILNRILNTPDDDEVGYIVEVDFSYPDSLHDLHSDFPLAPTKEAIGECWLSDYLSDLLADMQVKKPPQVKKLIQTLFDKQNYTLHYQTLKLYVELGLVVTKLYRVLSFRQEKWLAPYVKLNTEKRKQAQNKFEEDFFKLMVNSSFGKTCEGKRNRMKVKLTRTEEETLKWTDKPEYQSSKIISEDLVTVCLYQSEILWDKPTIVGACILDLAKKFLFEFHYKVMKTNFDCQLLYSDTDSFVYEVRSRDFFAELQRIKLVAEKFDFSNFPPEHPLYSRENARVTLKFKDEMGSKPIAEFCGLKPKLYSIKLAEGKYKSFFSTTVSPSKRNHSVKKSTHSAFR